MAEQTLEQQGSSNYNILKVLGAGNIIQIALLLIGIYGFGIRLNDKVDAQDKRLASVEATIKAQLELDQKRDVEIGRLLERTDLYLKGANGGR